MAKARVISFVKRTFRRTQPQHFLGKKSNEECEADMIANLALVSLSAMDCPKDSFGEADNFLVRRNLRERFIQSGAVVHPIYCYAISGHLVFLSKFSVAKYAVWFIEPSSGF